MGRMILGIDPKKEASLERMKDEIRSSVHPTFPSFHGHRGAGNAWLCLPICNSDRNPPRGVYDKTIAPACEQAAEAMQLGRQLNDLVTLSMKPTA